MPFKETQSKQLALVKVCCINTESLDECAALVQDTLSTSPYLDRERIMRVSEAVGNRVRGLKNYLSKL